MYYVLTKVERCQVGGDLNQFLDVTTILGVFEDRDIAKRSVKAEWPYIAPDAGYWVDKDHEVSFQHFHSLDEDEGERGTHKLYTTRYEVRKFPLNTLMN